MNDPDATNTEDCYYYYYYSLARSYSQRELRM
jgi:hypothetical protein